MTLRITMPYLASDCWQAAASRNGRKASTPAIPGTRTTYRITFKGSGFLVTLARAINTKPTPAQVSARATFAATYAGQVAPPAPLNCNTPP